MKRVILLALLVGGLVVPAVAFGGSSPKPHLDEQGIASKQCKADHMKSKQLVDVHFTMLNDADSGFAGNRWANDTIDRQLRIFALENGTYCAVVSDHGKFVTFAGASPGGSSTVAAGIKGELEGGYVTTFFTGTYAPTLPTHGNLGTWDLQCDASFNCPGDVGRPSVFNTTYFSSTSGADLAQWGWIYKSGKHGTWLNQDDVTAANSGDIN